MPRYTSIVLLTSTMFLAACGGASATGAAPHGGHGATASAGANDAAMPVGPAASDKTISTVYESYLSPQQQPGEETDAPKLVAKLVGVESSGTSTPREQRKSLGHGRIRFARNLSRAFVDVSIEGVDPADIVMLHVHCGPPGVLGPIIVDLGEFGDLGKRLVNGTFSAELSNKHIRFITDMPHGLKPTLPESCPVEPGFPTQAMTIAALEYLARKGVLYFNLHTKSHSYYGEVRGQIYAAKE